MILRVLSSALICVGILLVALGLSYSRLFPTAFVSDELSEEYSEAATAYHAATVGSSHDRGATSVATARQRFEEARSKVDEGRSRQKSTRWLLNTGGFALVIVGGLLHLVHHRAS